MHKITKTAKISAELTGRTAKPTKKRHAPYSVSERADGRWSFTVEFARRPDGTRNRHCSTRNTEGEAEAAARELWLRGGVQIQLIADSLTVSQLLTRSMTDYDASDEYSTRRNLAWLHQIIDSYLGDVLVTQLSTNQVEELLKRMRADDRARSTVKKVYGRLCRVLDLAVSEGVVQRNVALAVRRRPREEAKVPEIAWTQDEVHRILAATVEVAPRLLPLVLLAFCSGVRIGELIGARREDYTLADNVLRVTGTAKEGGGRGKGKSRRAHRTIALPEATADVMRHHLQGLDAAKLRAGAAWGVKRAFGEDTRAKQQQAALKQHGRAYSQAWTPAKPVPTERHEWLFPTTRGTRYAPRNIGRQWHQILETAGVPQKRFHAVRGTWITAALKEKVSLPEIQAAVGHASPVMTLRYYLASGEGASDAATRAAAHIGLSKKLPWLTPGAATSPDSQ